MQTVQSMMWRLMIFLAFLLVTPSAGHAERTSLTQPAAQLACSTPLTLTLRPGLHVPNSEISIPAAPNIPPGPMVIKLPLYPGARVSTYSMSHAQAAIPASRYLKSASAEYEVNTGWTTAANWYRRAFGTCGYTESGHGSLELHGVTVSIGITMHAPKPSTLAVSLAFTHGPTGKTLVQYVAYMIALPPPAIMVPGHPRSVTIFSYRPRVEGQLASRAPEEYVVVRDAASIAELARHLNTLPPPQGVMSCPADDGSHDRLVFAYAGGGKRSVDVGLRGCRIVRSGHTVALALSDEKLFGLLDTLLSRPAAVYPHGLFRSRAVAQTSTRNTPIGEATAFSLCGAHPTLQERIWIRGWFEASISAYGYEEGGLFSSQQAVPHTVTNRWDVNGRWLLYGALFTHVTTHASFGPRTVTLHGLLDCATYRFWTDRDPFPPPNLKLVYGPPRVGRAGAITTWASAGGLRLTLTVPRRSYPRDALARVSVSIRNVSRHDIGYWGPGISLPGVTSPQPEVLNIAKQIVFPPAMPYMPALPGPAPSIQPLHPGAVMHASDYIVVRGARIRASQQFSPTWSLNPTVQRALNTLVTHPIIVRLTREQAPQLTLHQTTGGPVVDVQRPAGVTGQMVWLNYADCGDTTTGPDFQYSFGWVGTGPHLTPGCSPVRAWHFRVAWLNHSVAGIDYMAPQPMPAPTRTSVVR